VHWLTSKTTSAITTARRVAARVATRSTAGLGVELAGFAGLVWGLHEAWAPLAGIVGGPLLVALGMAMGDNEADG
jgi:hypothetical protein